MTDTGTEDLMERSGERWRPSRAGILNVWRYYREVLTFHQGRLLLRGRNGTGKSKALELLLPFLLDASLRPNRLSTFGGNERVMHWNMIGHGYPGATRVGYVWLEFERPGPSGSEFLTLGARLQATRDVSSVKATYFTAAARVGDSLSLLTPEEQPLTVKQLKEAVEERGVGTVYPGPEEYRSAVRSLLYPKLDQARYDALITALLQLRTPKLSERLDPGLLSSLLSSALPPLGRGELADIAGGFERLDRHRVELQALTKEVEAAKALADRQRLYASRVLRGAAADLISATTDADRCGRAAGEAERAASRAMEDLERLALRESELEEGERSDSSELQGLRESEAYRAGAGIALLREQAGQAEAEAERKEAEAGRRRASAVRSQSQARELTERTARADRGVAAARSVVERAAERADLAGLFGEAIVSLEGAGAEGVGSARRLLRATAENRRAQIGDVLTALDVYHDRLRRREELESDLGELAEELADAEALGDKSAAEHEARLADLHEALAVWARGLSELSLDDTEALADQVDPDSGAGPHTAVAAARQRAGETLAALRQGIRQRAQDIAAERSRVAAEITEWESQKEVAPPAPRTRTGDRSELRGAPMWRLVAFADSIPDAERAGVEAALEASGLLDAWVLPDGSVPAAGVVGDTVATAAARPVRGPSLLDVLTVEEDAAVPAEHVRTLLAGIAYTGSGQTPSALASGPEPGSGRSAPVAVGGDGHWRMGPLHGHWSKPEPAYIGARARERARARAVAELSDRLRALDTDLTGAEAELETLAERRQRLDAEAESLPSDTVTRASAQEARSAQERIADRHRGLERQRQRLNAHLPVLSAAEQDLRTVAARHRLPAEREALESARAALATLGQAVEDWLDGQVELSGLVERRDRAVDLAQEEEQEAAETAEAASRAQANARDLRQRLAAMDSTVGVEHRRVQERVAAVERRLSALSRELSSLRADRLTLRGRHGELLGEVRGLRERHEAAVAARDAAADRFRSLFGTPLHEDSGLDASLPPDPTVRDTLETARAVAATSERADHSPERISGARAKVAEAVHAVRDTLAARTYLELTNEGEIQEVSALLDGVRVGACGLHDALVGERRVRSTDLTDEERALFDRVLTGDTRRHLADRLRRANGLVEGMNDRLSRVRTASRISVRLRWDVAPDAPAGTERARGLLQRDPRNLGDDEREALHGFFRERIDDARADDSASSWEEHLSQVLDYTAWHRFTVELDKDDGAGWQQLTRRAHGRLSGGEKAIALHLPLFAAVAAHYTTDAQAPRFILLDEVFVGVDAANRGQIFALLVDLDLDMVLTSDHEWCTYAELDGIAVHQLIPGEADEADDAVTTARWVWTGRALEVDEADEAE
ncbi:TIGR02680 family protein [Nocardiopsis metallicus]|uniref:Uncharacterized protein (TIGR02680 family) n=1 Tax=Nocardiopsis metallicus TaxID=179819 RepID=A0A840WC22_9ACTN|nr:TIGR02680 family protein [Nocardiopsis metallicus]MBB5489575.1 uncharacterized protein (TIGR02680 family) [Nocardiopsis metallicus]